MKDLKRNKLLSEISQLILDFNTQADRKIQLEVLYKILKLYRNLSPGNDLEEIEDEIINMQMGLVLESTIDESPE